MLTGHHPFEGENPLVVMNARLISDPTAPRKLNPALSPQIEEIILHAMEREPATRYPSAAAMKAELDDPSIVQVTGRADRLQAAAPWMNTWQQYRTIALAIVIPLIIVIICALFAWFAHRPK
jgi:serine/threonine-protein kinase